MTEATRPRWLPYVLAALCLAVRLPGLELPLFEEGHAYRQSSTAMVARNFSRHGYRLFWPELDLVRWSADEGVREGRFTNSEFPLYPYAVALLYRLTGVREAVGRLVSAFCAVGAMLLLYGAVRMLWGDWAATVAAAFYALSPLTIFYTRAFLPEPLMLLLEALAVNRLIAWCQTDSRRDWAWLLLAATLAPMVKQPALCLLLAVTAGCLVKSGWAALRRWDCWLLILLPIGLTTAWYSWAQYLGREYVALFAIGGGRGLINPDLWLHNHANFYPRLAATMLILVGSVTGWLVALAAIRRPVDRREWILWGWFVGNLVMCLVAGGATISHYYYDLGLVLSLAPLVGRGTVNLSAFGRRVASVAVLVGPLLVLTFPIVPHWYDLMVGEDLAAAAIRRTVPDDGLVMTLCYGTQLLYACDRRGGFILADPQFLRPEAVEEAVQAGFGYFATGRVDLLDSPAGERLREYLTQYRLLASGPGFVVYQLGEKVAEE